MPGWGTWMVIVRNDDYNTFDHVANTLARVVPGVSVERGYRIADEIHTTGPVGGRVRESRPSTIGSSWPKLGYDGAARAALTNHRRSHAPLPLARTHMTGSHARSLPRPLRAGHGPGSVAVSEQPSARAGRRGCMPRGQAAGIHAGGVAVRVRRSHRRHTSPQHRDDLGGALEGSAATSPSSPRRAPLVGRPPPPRTARRAGRGRCRARRSG